MKIVRITVLTEEQVAKRADLAAQIERRKQDLRQAEKDADSYDRDTFPLSLKQEGVGKGEPCEEVTFTPDGKFAVFTSAFGGKF